jgi:hypothetical protein
MLQAVKDKLLSGKSGRTATAQAAPKPTGAAQSAEGRTPTDVPNGNPVTGSGGGLVDTAGEDQAPIQSWRPWVGKSEELCLLTYGFVQPYGSCIAVVSSAFEVGVHVLHVPLHPDCVS